MAAKIKKGDMVEVIRGEHARRRGPEPRPAARGRVLEVIPDKGLVLVEGVNIVKKHNRMVRAKDGSVSGGITEQEAPIAIANVALIDPATGRPTRVGFKKEGDKKVRVARTKGTGTVLDS